MFQLIVLLASAIVVMGAPQGPRPYYPRQEYSDTILSQVFDQNPIDNSYISRFETSNGIFRNEEGVVKNPGTPVEALSVTGSYNYVGDDGQPYAVNYIADDYGFQPVGPHIHPAIIKAVQEQVERARREPPYVYDPRQDY